MAIRTVLVLTLALGMARWIPAEEPTTPQADDQARKELEERLKAIPEGENTGKAKTKGLKEGKAGAGEPAQDGEMYVKFMQRFDENGDGKLDEAERAKAQEAYEKKDGPLGERGGEMRKKALEMFDANKDGKLDDKERAKLNEHAEKMKNRTPEEMKKDYLARFDANKDGKLDEKERVKAQEEFLKMRQAGAGRGDKNKGDAKGPAKTADAKSESVMTLSEADRAKAMKDFDRLFEEEKK